MSYMHPISPNAPLAGATTDPSLHFAMPGNLAGAGIADGDTNVLGIAPVLHPKDGVPNPASRTFWSASANALYIIRQRGSDLFGPTPDFTDRLRQGNDLVDHGRRGPMGCDADAVAGMALWEAADRATQTDRPSAAAAFHIVGWLPTNATGKDWRDLALAFLDRAALANGMVADWAIHALADADGRWIKRPHLHAVLTHRFWRPGRRTGEPNVAWLGTPRHRQRLLHDWETVLGGS